MAAVSTLMQARRRKQATYGKASRNANTWNVSTLDDEEDELAHPKVIIERTNTVKETYPVQKREPKPHALKSIKSPAKKADAWDIPSSDDEVGNTITRRSPPKSAPKRKLVNVVEEAQAPLAPWEQKKAEQSQQTKEEVKAKRHVRGDSRTHVQSSVNEVAKEKDNILRGPSAQKNANGTKELRTVAAPPAKSPPGSSAAARLKARRLLSGSNAPVVPGGTQARVQKRVDDESLDANSTPRKRLRSEAPPDVVTDDLAMTDAPAPKCESPEAQARMADVFDFSETDEDEGVRPAPKLASRRPAQARKARGKLATVNRSSPMKMDSAPARLSDMLNMDTDTTDTASRSPSVSSSRPVTPQKPRNNDNGSPETAVKASGTLTPKQAKLWDRLLPEDSSAASPSVLPMQDLTLHTVRRTGTKPSNLRAFTKSSSDLGPTRRRTKLVDRLKASAPSSDNESSENSEEETDLDNDVKMSSDDNQAEEAAAVQSQSQSQSQIVVESGPKITYARTRSYLPEDSLEDELMLGLNRDFTQQSAPYSWKSTSKPKSQSQKSAYDLEESDDEDTGGKLRSIHELRAGGGNQRFMDEVGGLLEDIAEHQSSSRSRRRTAIIELAKKLEDKVFVEKFFRQGFEQKLLDECEHTPDDVADTALTAAFATMLSGEPPEHVAHALKDGGLIAWLQRLLSVRTDPRKLAKDRRNNMSKSAQSTFTDFLADLAGRDVWGKVKPTVVTPRTISLLALDNIVGKLRRSGDRSEILDAAEFRAVLPTEEEVASVTDKELPVDVTLAISVLESLSATGVSQSWSTDVVERIRSVLVLPEIDSDNLSHLRFLSLRLCLNLTNDHVRNCKIFAKPPMIHCLLRGIHQGFNKLFSEKEEAQRVIYLDLVLLDMGVAINLTEHNVNARESAAAGETGQRLSDLVAVFRKGQERMLEAESVEDGFTNVAYGYLAVVLAILCRNGEAKQIIASSLPSKNLSALIAAVEEFLKHHRKVDTLNFSGEEGNEVWSSFTERLNGVLDRLKIEAQTV